MRVCGIDAYDNAMRCSQKIAQFKSPSKSNDSRHPSVIRSTLFGACLMSGEFTTEKSVLLHEMVQNGSLPQMAFEMAF